MAHSTYARPIERTSGRRRRKITDWQPQAGLPAGFSASVWQSNPDINSGEPSLLWQAEGASQAQMAAGEADNYTGHVQTHAQIEADALDIYYAGQLSLVGVASGTETGGTVVRTTLYAVGDALTAVGSLATAILMATTSDSDSDQTYVVRGGESKPKTLQNNFKELTFPNYPSGNYGVSGVSEPYPKDYIQIALDAPDDAVSPNAGSITFTTIQQLANAGFPVWYTPTRNNQYHVSIIVPGATTLTDPVAKLLYAQFTQTDNPKKQKSPALVICLMVRNFRGLL